jgi:dienelactone hydrolase
MFKQLGIKLRRLPPTAVALAFCAFAVMMGMNAGAAAPVSGTKTVDLTKTPIRGLAVSLKVTVYQDSASGEKRPLVVLIPKFGAQMSDAPYAQQAEYFVQLGYVVAIPHLTGLYNDGVKAPVYDARMDADLVAETAPFAVEVLAMVADLSAAQGPSTANHVIVGEGLGSIIAARYAALGVPGCKGIILISAGFGPKRSRNSSFDDMRASEDAFRQLGAKVSVSSLWVYAKENKRVSESTANDLFTAYKSGNAGARLVVLPQIGMDGDALFSKAEPGTTWAEPVSAFLRSIEFH